MNRLTDRGLKKAKEIPRERTMDRLTDRRLILTKLKRRIKWRDRDRMTDRELNEQNVRPRERMSDRLTKGGLKKEKERRRRERWTN